MVHIKDKLKNIIEKDDTKIGRAFAFSIQALIVISLISFSIETLPNLSQTTILILTITECITVIIFTIEYILRIIITDKPLRYIFSLYGIIDLIAILPFYITSGVDLRASRIFRLLRIFRVLKLFRYTKVIRKFKHTFRSIKNELTLYLVSTLFLLYVTSVGIYYFENEAQPEHFSSVFHSLWWAVVTLTTVGYGDVYPITLGGRIFTFFVLIIGLGVIAVPSSLLASALIKYDGK